MIFIHIAKEQYVITLYEVTNQNMYVNYKHLIQLMSVCFYTALVILQSLYTTFFLLFYYLMFINNRAYYSLLIDRNTLTHIYIYI